MSRHAIWKTRGKPQPLPRTIVTGATSGIGWELATQLADAGVPVVAIGRNEEKLRELSAYSSLITVFAAELDQIDNLEALVAAIVSKHPDVGCLINNAGVQYDCRVDDVSCSIEQIRREVDVNLVAPMVLVHALLPHLQSRRVSFIINVTSVLAHSPKRTAAVYSATKAGLHMFVQALRVQVRGATVQVVEVVMPLVDTPMTKGRGSGKISAADAARELIEGVLAGKQDIGIGKARWLPLMQRWAPALLARVVQRT